MLVESRALSGKGPPGKQTELQVPRPESRWPRRLPKGGTAKRPRSKWRAEDRRLSSGVLDHRTLGQEGTPGIVKLTPLILWIRKRRCREDSLYPWNTDSPVSPPRPLVTPNLLLSL